MGINHQVYGFFLNCIPLAIITFNSYIILKLGNGGIAYFYQGPNDRNPKHKGGQSEIVLM